MRLPKRLFPRRERPDPSLEPADIMASLPAHERNRLRLQIARAAEESGPCATCGDSTNWLRPIAILEPDSRLLGAARGESRILVIRFCPDHNTPDDAARYREALVGEARERHRAGLDPLPIPAPI